MNVYKEKTKDFYLKDTAIENVFINEYLPAAPGDFVKVFIYAYMYAEYGLDLDDEMMARELGLSTKEIIDAWNFWEKMGVIRRRYLNEEGEIGFAVEFINRKEQLYGKAASARESDKQEEAVYESESLKRLFSTIEQKMGRSLSSTEVTKIVAMVVDDRIPPELILYGITYCKEKGKSSLKYIESVIRGWYESGLSTEDQVARHLEEVDGRHYQYRRIMKALGFSRNPSEAEQKMMDEWLDIYGFHMDRILEACGETSGISNPNFKYVNSVLLNWKKAAEQRGSDDVNQKVEVTQSQLRQYYEYLREHAAEEAEKRLQEVYQQIPRIREIDEKFHGLGARLSRELILGREGEKGSRIRSQMDKLTEERAYLLTEHDYPIDYTDIQYYCDKCHDTGITDMGERCSCVLARMEEAEIWIKTKGE